MVATTPGFGRLGTFGTGEAVQAVSSQGGGARGCIIIVSLVIGVVGAGRRKGFPGCGTQGARLRSGR